MLVVEFNLLRCQYIIYTAYHSHICILPSWGSSLWNLYTYILFMSHDGVSSSHAFPPPTLFSHFWQAKPPRPKSKSECLHWRSKTILWEPVSVHLVLNRQALFLESNFSKEGKASTGIDIVHMTWGHITWLACEKTSLLGENICRPPTDAPHVVCYQIYCQSAVSSRHTVPWRRVWGSSEPE